MTRPSEPLLKWLRGQLAKRGLNTAAVAEKIGRDRAELRRLLSGADAMTVDDLLAITQALELSPQELGLAGESADGDDGPEPPENPEYRNQPEAILRLGFDLGIDILFVADPARLAGWGGPDAVVERAAGEGLAIKLDAAFHRYMAPAFEPEGFSVGLMFGDRLHRCTFPWASFRRIEYRPYVPDEPAPAPPEPEKKAAPFLRLVK